MNKGDTQVSKEKNGNVRTTILLNGKSRKMFWKSYTELDRVQRYSNAKT